MLLDALRQITHTYAEASSQPFAGHPIANIIRHDIPKELKETLGVPPHTLTIKGSPGNGNWADIPWVALLDPIITSKPAEGFYPVYLIDPQANRVYLSLNQGAQSVINEFGMREAQKILQHRSNVARKRLSDLKSDFEFEPIRLNAKSHLARAYEAGHILGYCYKLNLPISEEALNFDLNAMLQAYQILIHRNGIDTRHNEDGETASDLYEHKKLRLHLSTERSTQISKAVKKALGHTCQACDLNLYAMYGELGRDYIEAHHLQPLSTLREGTRIKRNINKDFAVLCPNCHRMIHRMDDPSDLSKLKEIIRLAKQSSKNEQPH